MSHYCKLNQRPLKRRVCKTTVKKRLFLDCFNRLWMILHWKVWKRMALRCQQNSEFGLYFELLVRKRNPGTRPIMLIPPFPPPPLLRNNCMKNRNTNRIVDSIDPLMVVVRIPSKRRKYLFLNFTLSCISQTWMTFESLSMQHFFVMWRSEKLSSQRYLP